MNEAETTQAALDRKALEALVVGNKDLERLKALLEQFNIFEAIGVVRQELRHSDFLAFLLDPQESHDLGDVFVKWLLQRVITDAVQDSLPLAPVELELSNLDQMTVLREWQHIDVLLLDESNRLAVIIENKIDTGEHSDQLQRYFQTVNQHYPEYRIVGLYLSPSGEEPSHEAYLPVSYSLVCEVLDDLIESRTSILNADLQTLATHYTQMLRRHIVGDSEIANLCREIYRKHQRALDLIFDHRFSHQEAISKVLRNLIKETPDVIYEQRWTDYPKQEFINFGIRGWNVSALRVAKGWTSSNSILLFCCCNWADSVDLRLQIGPGDEEARQKLLSMASNNQAVFESTPGVWGEGKWFNIFVKSMLTSGFYENTTDSKREAEIRKSWAEFLERDLPRIDAALKKERWIWDRPDGTEKTTR